MNTARATQSDTIAAIATPPGNGGVGIVRLSGPQAAAIARRVAGDMSAPRLASLRNFRNRQGDVLDSGLLLYFPAPASYTGEDVVELQAHGGQVVLQMLLEALVQAGARHARPGEFTERAFINERIDLLQAEAVADLIEAGSREAALAAQHSLQGDFSQGVNALTRQIIELRTWVEAAIDFSEDEIDVPGNADLQQRIQHALNAVAALCVDAENGQALRDGLTIAILGQPNAGKSSLLNSLARNDTAIVTDIPGTTRDLLHARVVLDGLVLTITDTAGLRDSTDPIEREGMKRARQTAQRSALALLLIDDRNGVTDMEKAVAAELPEQVSLLPVLNKCDLSENSAGRTETALGPGIRISVKTGAGLDALQTEIRRRAGLTQESANPVIARQRHRDALARASVHIDQAVSHIRAASALEIAAEELRLCQLALDEITGVFSNEDLLGAIFSTFCLGK